MPRGSYCGNKLLFWIGCMCNCLWPIKHELKGKMEVIFLIMFCQTFSLFLFLVFLFVPFLLFFILQVLCVYIMIFCFEFLWYYWVWEPGNLLFYIFWPPLLLLFSCLFWSNLVQLFLLYLIKLSFKMDGSWFEGRWKRTGSSRRRENWNQDNINIYYIQTYTYINIFQ